MKTRCFITNHLWLSGVIGAGALLMASSAPADTIDELMRRLKAKGILTEKEYATLSAQRAAAPPTPQGQADAVDALMRRLKAKGILTQQEYAALSAPRPEAKPAPAQAVATAPQPATTLPPETAPAQQAATAPPPTFVRMMEKGVGLHIGPVDLVLSGGVNAFYVEDMPQNSGDDTTVLGGLANVGSGNAAAVRNGLLPSNFIISLKTHQRGFDVGATFGFYPGLNSVNQQGGANSAGNPKALGTSGIDFRQNFLTVGNERIGTFKGGRDIGMFGSEAILNDFSLIGVGSPGSNVAPSNTSFGRIGLGYVYTDFMPQLTYMSPTFAGLQGSIGVFTPLDAVNFSSVSGTLEAHDEPGFQGKLTYGLDLGSIKSRLWTNFITQKLESSGGDDALPKGQSVRAYGFDLGGKFTWGPADLTLYGYTGKALGSTGLFFDAVSQAGKARDSYGFYVQGAYRFLEDFTLGLSYGASYLDQASDEDNPLLVERNDSELVGLHYQLTDWVKLVGEYVHTHSKAHGGNSADDDTVALGASLSF